MQGSERVDEPIAGGRSKEVNLMSFQCVCCISREVGRVSRKRFIIIYLYVLFWENSLSRKNKCHPSPFSIAMA